MTLQHSRRKLLGLYRELVHVALHDFPTLRCGRHELRRVRDWVKKDLVWDSELSMKRASGILRYSLGELRGIVSLAKFRAIRKNYGEN